MQGIYLLWRGINKHPCNDTVLYSTAKYSTLQHSTVLYSTEHYRQEQESTLQHSAVQYSIAQLVLDGKMKYVLFTPSNRVKWGRKLVKNLVLN